ncbi:MAG: phosphomannomutase [Fibrobacterales bacterium]
MRVSIEQLMNESGVTFGTSGARGLVSAMTDAVCYAYTRAFLQHLSDQGALTVGAGVAIAGDYRPSSERIMTAVGRAAEDGGYTAVNCGAIPSPAVALYGIDTGIPAIMVTGSHIPDDRNGIKFNKATGEINKGDETGIKSQSVDIPDGLFDSAGMFINKVSLPTQTIEADERYIARYVDYFGASALSGKIIGLYEHSTVGREEMYHVLTALGAEVIKLGYSDTFIPVDTEAIRPEDCILAKQWAKEYTLDAIASADGDCDRPLLSDEHGAWFRGDVLGVLCAEYLKADAAATPVSCNTVAEKSGIFKKVLRTRIGSPFVIAGMEQLKAETFQSIIGYEANGGFLTYSPFKSGEKELKALPTRDALLPIIAALLLSIQKETSLSQLAGAYPSRFTASDRLKEFPLEKSRAILKRLDTGSFESDALAIEELLKDECGTVDSIDRTDGVRITFHNREIVHLRPSGNAPEFRCYAEAESDNRAVELTQTCLNKLK